MMLYRAKRLVDNVGAQSHRIAVLSACGVNFA